jgi:2-polyprenyl-3-methyl-5-hydroxy-6-metoxy-1,4-benzoquinol methylase
MVEVKQDNEFTDFSKEVAEGERFEFGKNWSLFLAALNEDSVKVAEKSLKNFLEVETLIGKTFIDIGSGSGLFSLAARILGAKVHSLDYDPNSVACTRQLRQRFFPADTDWVVEQGSALDQVYLQSLGQFDVVYSWGVLHHTGQMWQALDNAHNLVAPGGKLFIAIYNDTGSSAARWVRLKKIYNSLPGFLRAPYSAIVIAPNEIKVFLRALLKLRLGEYLRLWTDIKPERGMNRWRDIIDWVGGYPYEYATPEQIFDFYRARGFNLTKLQCGGVGLGCNEFVFEKVR